MINYKVYKDFIKNFYNRNHQFKKGDDLINTKGKFIFEDEFVCTVHSQLSRDNIVGNDDDNWEERGKLIDMHRDLLNVIKKLKDDRLNALSDDSIALKYCQDYDSNGPLGAWIWIDDYYCAPLDDLWHITKVLRNV